MIETRDVFEELQEIIKEKIKFFEENREITLDSSFKILGADELDMFNIIEAVNEKFGIQISDEEADMILTVGQLLTKINNLLI